MIYIFVYLNLKEEFQMQLLPEAEHHHRDDPTYPTAWLDFACRLWDVFQQVHRPPGEPWIKLPKNKFMLIYFSLF